jgi:hypothetical protein
MRRMAIVAAAVAVAIGLAGCGAHPLVPAAALATPHPQPQRSPLLGVDVFAETPMTVSAAKSEGRTVLGYLHQGLHAQVAGLMWDLCSPGRHSEVVHICAADPATQTGSLSPADIAALAGIAENDGLQVAMRPIIRVGPPSTWNDAKRSWEGHIAPPDEHRWFVSLLAAETPYLQVAKRFHIEQFVVGTELAGLTYSIWWMWFLSQAHAKCGCEISYSAQMDQYMQNSPDLPPIKNVGADIYPKLALPASATQAQVTAGWEASLGAVARSRLEHTSLDEVSIRATAGAYKNPANWNFNGADDPAVQARYFTGACAAAARFDMRAVFFYYVPLNDSLSSPFTFPAFFVKNAGAAAISGCRQILAASNGS